MNSEEIKQHGEKTHIFTFMGTGAGCGVPAFFCTCPACMEARENPRARRGDCGAMVRRINEENRSERTLERCEFESHEPEKYELEKREPESREHEKHELERREAQKSRDALKLHTPTLLIDAPPDTRHQLLRESVTRFDELLITHCHSDHITGLCEYEYMMQLQTKRAIPTFGSVEALGEASVEFHYMDYALDMHTLDAFETHEFDGVKYTALPVTHAPGTFGYLIETPNTRIFYASDTGRLPEVTRKQIQGVDVLAMDATYWKSCPCPQSHHSVQECIEEGLELEAKKIYLTHLCMHYSEPITLVELEKYCEQYGGHVQPAADGLSFEI